MCNGHQGCVVSKTPLCVSTSHSGGIINWSVMTTCSLRWIAEHGFLAPPPVIDTALPRRWMVCCSALIMHWFCSRKSRPRIASLLNQFVTRKSPWTFWPTIQNVSVPIPFTSMGLSFAPTSWHPVQAASAGLFLVTFSQMSSRIRLTAAPACVNHEFYTALGSPPTI